MSTSSIADRIARGRWKRKPNQCWPWLKDIDSDGQGRFWLNKEKGMVSIQYAVYVSQGNEVPPGFIVLSCPVLRDCTNPLHIGIGTRSDASRVWREVRHRLKRERMPKMVRKLTDEQALAIYQDTDSYSRIAKKYGISKGIVGQIKTGRKYRKVTHHENRVDE